MFTFARVLWYFFFSRFFGFFHFYFCKSPGILFFFVFVWFVWFSRGFLDVCSFTFAGVLEYFCLVFSRFFDFFIFTACCGAFEHVLQPPQQ